MSTFLPYNQIYPVLGFIVRGSLSKLWIHKQYKTYKYVAKYYYPTNPRSAEQQGHRSVFADAVNNWQGFDDITKNYYNQIIRPGVMSGYNRYISYYLRSNPNMIIYWENIKQSATENITIPDYMSSDYFDGITRVKPVGSYPANPPYGAIRYRTDLKKLLAFNQDSGWSDLGGSGEAGSDTRIATIIVASDGSGDYTDIQSGIDALPDGGGLVSVKNGTYLITEPIVIEKSNVALRGQGTSTIITLDDDVNDNMVELGNGSDSFGNIEVSGFKVVGNKGNQTSGHGVLATAHVSNFKISSIWAYQVKGCGIISGSTAGQSYIFNCKSEECDTAGFYLQSSPNITIRDCSAINNGLTGQHGIYMVYAYNITISNCYFEGDATTNAQYGVYGDDSHKVKIKDCTFNGCRIAVYFTGFMGTYEKYIVVDNFIETTYSSAIVMSAPRGVVSNNRIYNAGGAGIYINASYYQVTDNYIKTTTLSGIIVYGFVCKVDGNVIENAGQHGIDVQNRTQNTIVNNNVYSCGLSGNNIYYRIRILGSESYSGQYHTVANNMLVGTSSGNKPRYAIYEEGAHVGSNFIHGNRVGANDVTDNFYLIGTNTKASENRAG